MHGLPSSQSSALTPITASRVQVAEQPSPSSVPPSSHSSPQAPSVTPSPQTGAFSVTQPSSVHTSVPLQGSPSSQPCSEARWTQPNSGSQLSVVQGSPSSHSSSAPAHEPSSPHTSFSVQMSPSSQGRAGSTVNVHSPFSLQLSTVQGSSSSQPPAPTHSPEVHASPVEQESPSSQAVPSSTGVNTQPSSASQDSSVHGLSSSQTSNSGVGQPEIGSQSTGKEVQALPSSQAAFEGELRDTLPHSAGIATGADISVVTSSPIFCRHDFTRVGVWITAGQRAFQVLTHQGCAVGITFAFRPSILRITARCKESKYVHAPSSHESSVQGLSSLQSPSPAHASPPPWASPAEVVSPVELSVVLVSPPADVLDVLSPQPTKREKGTDCEHEGV